MELTIPTLTYQRLINCATMSRSSGNGSKKETPGQWGKVEGGNDPPARPERRRLLGRSWGRAVRDKLEGEFDAALGCVLTEAPTPSLGLQDLGQSSWEVGEDGRGQGQTVSPRTPAVHGVPAGLELQAYPGEKGTKRGHRSGTFISLTGWHDSPYFQAK